MQGRRCGLVVSVVALLVASCGSEDSGATASAAPSCEEITAFADRIVDVGITYDYDPAESPSALADRSDVVFAGVLTGGFDSGDGDTAGAADGEYVSFGVEVTEVVVGDDSFDTGDEVYVSVDYNSAVVEAGEFEHAIAIGAPVVVFAHSTTDGRELGADIEGFMTACDGAKPIGLRGTIGVWPDIDSLDEVLRLAAED